MNIDQLLATHERETDKLIAEIRAFRLRKRESCDHLIYDGLSVQVQMLNNLGIRMHAVDELQLELYMLALEVFPVNTDTHLTT
jgi:hypothetical protein